MSDYLVVASFIRAFHVILRLQPKVNKMHEGRLCEVKVAASHRRVEEGQVDKQAFLSQIS